VGNFDERQWGISVSAITLAALAVAHHPPRNDTAFIPHVDEIKCNVLRPWLEQVLAETNVLLDCQAAIERQPTSAMSCALATVSGSPPSRKSVPEMSMRCSFAWLHSRTAELTIVSSTAGQRGEAFHADYAATKGALIALTKSLAIEYASTLVVNCVAPGWVDTEMSAPAFTAENREQIRKSIPIGRIASAEDIAGPILFLCSDLARHVTGEVLNVNGGSVLCG